MISTGPNKIGSDKNCCQIPVWDVIDESRRYTTWNLLDDDDDDDETTGPSRDDDNDSDDNDPNRYLGRNFHSWKA